MAALLLGSLMTQILLPILADELGGEYSETAHLVVPYSIAAIISVLCLQVVLCALWWLLSRVESGDIFQGRSLRAMNVIIVSLCLFAAIPAATMMHLLIGVGVGGPGVVMMLLVCVAGGAGLTLLAVISRALLREASLQHAELSQVI